jgi:nucleoid-associated protein YgaU
LTRRGWIVVAGLALALAAGAFRAGAATADERYVPTRQVVVQSGDTLWSIASALADGGQDVQGVVTRLQRINGLRGSTLQVGDVLEVPRE